MPPRFDPGGLVDQRYLLLEPQFDQGNTTLWLASDEVLGRRVALRVVSDLSADQAKEMLDVASKAGAVGDSRWARVLDLGSLREGRRRTAWLVTEWVDAPSLTAATRSGALPADQAAEVTRNAAAALATAHAAGLSPERLDADTVRVGAAGSVRLTGLERSQPLTADRERRDVAALGAVLLTAATGTRPTGPASSDTAWQAQPLHWLRRWRARRLVQLARRAIHGDFATVPRFARAVADAAAGTRRDRRARRTERPARWPGWVWRIAPPLVAITIGLVGWIAGRDLGRVPGTADVTSTFTPRPGATASGTPRLVWSRPPRVRSFDPGGDGAENPGAVGLAVDGDPSTAWTSEGYRSAHFGGLKPGVGLLLDLRRPRTITVAQLLLSGAGASMQIRAGDHLPQQLADLRQVALRNNAPAAVQVRLDRPTKARYWLVWFTELPKSGTQYRIGVAEVGLLR